jgi:hypothetical protein
MQGWHVLENCHEWAAALGMRAKKATRVAGCLFIKSYLQDEEDQRKAIWAAGCLLT